MTEGAEMSRLITRPRLNQNIEITCLYLCPTQAAHCCGCVPVQYLNLPIDYDTLQRVGSIMGSGGMVVMDENNCMVEIARFFLSFTRLLGLTIFGRSVKVMPVVCFASFRIRVWAEQYA